MIYCFVPEWNSFRFLMQWQIVLNDNGCQMYCWAHAVTFITVAQQILMQCRNLKDTLIQRSGWDFTQLDKINPQSLNLFFFFKCALWWLKGFCNFAMTFFFVFIQSFSEGVKHKYVNHSSLLENTKGLKNRLYKKNWMNPLWKRPSFYWRMLLKPIFWGAPGEAILI